MITLTGFDDSPKTPDEWRAYIRALKERRDRWLAQFSEEKARRPLSARERLRFLSRFDLISEHISRAEYVLQQALERNLDTATEGGLFDH